MTKKRNEFPWFFIGVLFLVVFGYILLHDIVGGTLFNHVPFDSYTLQAQAWLNGETFIANGQNYSWLELAVFEGKYYTSFPPLPTIPLIPLVLFFGEKTPNNVIVIFYTIIAFVGVYKAFRAKGAEQAHSVFWSVFIIFACNVMEISSYGGVWLQAQTLNLALLVWGIYFAIRQKRITSILLLALAVGCRPFSILYIPVALYYFYWHDKQNGLTQDLKNLLSWLWKPLLAAFVIGAVYAWYNYIRFGNPIEFGHNYLPEFVDAENGQFHFNYLWNNLRNILFRPIGISNDARLELPMFSGFMFYVANPIFLLWVVRIVRDVYRKNMKSPMLVITVGLILNLICLCLHKTFGGWQFGARYTIDLIPYVLFYLLLSGNNQPSTFAKILCGFGLLFNAYGTINMRLYHLLH